MPLLFVILWKNPNLKKLRVGFGLLAAAYAIGQVGVLIFEPLDNPIRNVWNFNWFYEVTAGTVGYGDLYPRTRGGHIAIQIMMPMALAGFAFLLGQFTDWANLNKSKRMLGLMRTKATGQTVIMGYWVGRTEELVRDLRTRLDSPIVLAATPEMAASNPLHAHGVAFATGTLDGSGVMELANIAAAERVIIDVGDDDRSLAVALAVRSVNPTVRIVVSVSDLGRQRNFGPPPISATCVPQNMPALLAAEALNAGVMDVLWTIMDPSSAHSLRCIAVPDIGGNDSDGWPIRDVAVAFISQGATLQALRKNGGFIVNPVNDAELRVQPGDVVLYLDENDLPPSALSAIFTR